MVVLAMGEAPNVARVREALAACNRGDVEAMRPFLAPDIVWHVGGDDPLSGDYRGRDAVLESVANVMDLTRGTLKAEPIDIRVSDRHAGLFQRTRASGRARSSTSCSLRRSSSTPTASGSSTGR